MGNRSKHQAKPATISEEEMKRMQDEDERLDKAVDLFRENKTLLEISDETHLTESAILDAVRARLMGAESAEEELADEIPFPGDRVFGIDNEWYPEERGGDLTHHGLMTIAKEIAALHDLFTEAIEDYRAAQPGAKTAAQQTPPAAPPSKAPLQ